MGMLVKEGLGKGKEGVMERLAREEIKVEIEILRREKKNVEIEMGVEELAKRERLVREEIKVEMEMGVKKLAKIEIKRMKGKNDGSLPESVYNKLWCIDLAIEQALEKCVEAK